MSEPKPFHSTARGQLVQREGAPVGDTVTFYTADGTSYTTDNPVEITRLRSSRAHFASKEAADDPVAADDTRFHPDQHTIVEVAAYIQENPRDAERVLAEEKSGKARTGIVKDAE